MSCCGRAAATTPLIQANLPTIWSWVTGPNDLVPVPLERVEEVFARLDGE